MLEAALEAGLSAAGVDVYLCGPLPTPGGRLPDARAAAVGGHRDQRVAQSVRRQRHQVLLRRRAPSCPTTSRRAIERAMDAAARVRAVGASSARRGASTTPPGRYIEFCKSTFPDRARSARHAHRRRLRARRRLPRRAAGVPRARRRRRSRSATSPNGININDGVGATHPEVARGSRCASTSADLGIALDGDGDRLRDGRRATGALYDGDQLLYVIATRLPAARRARRAASSAR